MSIASSVAFSLTFGKKLSLKNFFNGEITPGVLSVGESNFPLTGEICFRIFV